MEEAIVRAQMELISMQLDETNRPRLLLSLPQSAGDIFLSTAILPSIKETYPDYDIYYACMEQFFDILKDNPYIYKVIEYNPIILHQPTMEGTGNFPGFFDISIFLSTNIQILSNYLNNGKTRIALNLRKNNYASN